MLLKGRFFGTLFSVRFVLFALVICACILSPAAVQALTQAQITAAMGAGWNLGNQLEANSNGTPSETVWGNPMITQNLINAVKAAGFSTIRIPVSFLSKIGAAPSYTLDATWLARVKAVVDYVYSAGMYAIIDGVHGDGYTTVTGGWILVASSDQTTIKAKYKALWQQIATTFASYDEHVIYESMNEVFDGNYSDPSPAYYANLDAYNQIFVDTVRQAGGNNTTRWLLVPGWNTNIGYMVGDYGFVIPTDTYRSSTIPSTEQRIMISAHYYDPWDFVGDTSSSVTQWGSISTDSTKKSTWGQEDWMISQIAAMYYAYVTQGYPVVIGEFSSTDKTNMDSTNNTYRAYWAKTLCTDCKMYGAVPVYWDNGANGSGGCAIFDRNTYATTQSGILSSIMSGMSTTTTPVPTAAPTAVPTPGPAAKINVLYKCINATASTGQIQFAVQVQNADTVAIPLTGVKVRYWYTRDSTSGQTFSCDYAVLGSSNITGTPVKLGTAEATSTADYYVEIGFGTGAGSLSPGASTGEVQCRLNQSSGASYTQTNDYSFVGTLTDYGQNSNVAGYVNLNLESGTEPSGATPAPTAVPTAIPTIGPTAVPTAVPTTAPTTAPGTKGDVNGSGTVDIVDALLIAQYYVGLNPAGFVSANADVNCSGTIDIVDALVVAQYYVGLVTSFPC
jgi:aryl-phospho-beta-D-glucosidase BglC (GH1 family)